eukprot:scaffold132992_cov78-Phaeocystis_antarctica.AAC.5
MVKSIGIGIFEEGLHCGDQAAAVLLWSPRGPPCASVRAPRAVGGRSCRCQGQHVRHAASQRLSVRLALHWTPSPFRA